MSNRPMEVVGTSIFPLPNQQALVSIELADHPDPNQVTERVKATVRVPYLGTETVAQVEAAAMRRLVGTVESRIAEREGAPRADA